ncbi:MAG TPA: PAS domain S-box protein [Polyangiaceae bacterium]|jgi:PAS domain S-box-containing protein|nr:PAS domain S-box protein [Polyangiaceae bacterium]HNZ22782.1 PAS domain S-box protein [Polyangiaceae bacterium]HOD22847.1 PAS domain S-box protein [Polyangiaceae bacterium]HOE47680.1 PAS domain S-box protein [Polyangiaceae bacterium]HOH01195.1 PAS domain S-box protein [Polyangiaceae bacterium]
MPAERRPRIKRSVRALALARAQARSSRLAAIYSALSAVHASVSESKSVTDMFGRACQAIVEQHVFRGAWAGRFRNDGLLHVLAVAGSFQHSPPETLVAASPEQAWVQSTSLHQTTVVRPDDPPQRRDPILDHLACSSALYVPVESDSGVLGVLCVATNDPRSFDREVTAMLIELGRSLSANAGRINAEQALASQRELLRAVFDSATVAIYYATAEGKLLLCNDAFLRLVGRQRDDTVGQSYQVVSSPDFREYERTIVQRVLSSGLPSEYDKDVVRSDGFRIPVRLSVAPIRDRNGKSTGTVAILRDTVAEREAAFAYRESEQRYRAVFYNNPDAILVLDAKRNVVDANPAATGLTGLARDQLLGREMTELLEPSEMPSMVEALSIMRQRGTMYRPLVRFRRTAEHTIPTEVHGTSLGPQLWQVLARNIESRLEAQEKLRALNDQLEEKVAARTAQLKEAYAKIEHAGRMKDEFLANMSHELRTPLNSVLGLADALLEGVFGDVDEQQQQIVQTMRDSGHHLLDLINDILDLSKIEAGRLTLDLRPIRISEVCQVSLRMIRPLALDKRIGSWMRVDPRCPVAVADERRLKQMLVNLLVNAVKFTPAGGQVGLEAWMENDSVFFSVCDTGIGISPPDLRRIFEPFTQIDSSLARQHEGTGLGLALVRRLAELHQGHIDVVSEPGQGSRFTIVLPRVEPDVDVYSADDIEPVTLPRHPRTDGTCLDDEDK